MNFLDRVRGVSDPIRKWIIRQFINAIQRMTDPADRRAAVDWLAGCRDIVQGTQNVREKIRALNSSIDHRGTARAIANTVSTSVRNYRDSDLPLPVKLALPATLAAAPFVGGHAVGLAALGGAVGAPALLLLFIGAAGITSIIEAVAKSPERRGEILSVIATILRDEQARRFSNAMRDAMRDAPRAAEKAAVPEDEIALRAALATMDPYAFESHVMSFYQAAGLFAWVTPKSNDFGIDGFARHPQGLIAVQCKRYGPTNKVGAPDVQRFKGALHDNGALRGHIVTTSSFTADAIMSASKSEGIVLVDMDELVRWHSEPPPFVD